MYAANILVGIPPSRQTADHISPFMPSRGGPARPMTECLRPGVSTWLVGEARVYEIEGAGVAWVKDAKTGLSLLQPGA
jgi:hypothetical protein